MIINFRQVNIAICHHLQLSLNERSCICEGDSLYCWPFSRHNGLFFEIIKVFRTCSTRLFVCRPIQTSVVEHFFASLLLLSYICVFFSFFRWTVPNRGTQMRRKECYISSEFLLFDLAKRWSATVLPTKSDSDVMLRLQSYQGLIIDRLREY